MALIRTENPGVGVGDTDEFKRPRSHILTQFPSIGPAIPPRQQAELLKSCDAH